MAKAAAAVKTADPAQERREVVARVLARRPPDTLLHYPNPAYPDKPFIVRKQPEEDRLPPVTIGEWVDDRIIGCFGSQAVLNEGQAAAFAVLEAMRTGDPATVRAAVGRVGRDLDDQLRWLVYGTIGEWRGKAISPAMAVTDAALSEAARLGWNVPPRLQRRRAS